MIVRERTAKTREKIKEIEDLPRIFSVLRAENKKIVHCHGVFDLLHIGHIRHFEQARSLGDILVVTVTPDRYVNKGPHRPAFSEHLRVEAIAALNCVDYVAINKWPTAVETVRLLQPDFYVKGSDYKDAEKDHTGGIVQEEAAVKSVGGQLVFTEDITFSASNLVNRYLSVFPKEVSDYLSRLASRYSANDILAYINDARPLKTLIVGESIIDEYQYCEAIGKSSKEPMLAVKRLSTEKFAGGVLAVGNHIANFCDRVGVLTFLGAENSQEEFIREQLNQKIDKIFLYRKDSPTIVKRRLVENYFFTKLLEVYEINDIALDLQDNEAMCAALNKELPKYDIVIVMDFGHSMLTKEAIQLLCEKAKFLAVNAQSNAGNLGYHAISRYPRADYICIAEPEVRIESRDRRGDLREMVKDISRRLHCGKIAVTRGNNGCLCYDQETGFSEAPALAGQVVDRMGAGDAFLSLTALCVARNIPMEVVGFIGNAVGGQAVATVGHRTSIERAPLFKSIETLLK